MKPRSILSAAALATAVAFAAAPNAQAQQPTPAGAAGQQQATTQQDLWTTAETRGFQEWTRGAQAAGLQERLGDRPHTAFIADDAAYQQVPATQRQAWQTDPAAQRGAFGHTVVEGRLTMQDLRQRDHVTTIDGQRIPVRVEGDRVFVGDAQIREGDIAAGTGTIHQVDRVTWPQQQMQPGQQQHQHQPGQQMQPGQQQPGQQVQPGQQQPGMQQPVRERVRKDYSPGARDNNNRDNNDG